MSPIAITTISNIIDYLMSRTLSMWVNYRIFTCPNGKQRYMKFSSVAIILILFTFTPRSRKLTDTVASYTEYRLADLIFYIIMHPFTISWAWALHGIVHSGNCYYRSVPGKRPLPGKRPVTYGKRPGSFCMPAH